MSDEPKSKPDSEATPEEEPVEIEPEEEAAETDEAAEVSATPDAAEEVDQERDKVAAILAYVPFLCFYALLFKKDDPFAFHHGKQGSVLFALELIAIALRWNLIWNLVLIGLGAIAIWGIVSVWRGNEFRIPILSDLLDQYQP
ncbi:hypothetical protein KKA00_02140 [bacterium]|nr:hypothetical protein [bacterium]MBU1650993.1 hypothetical protein [bacterium]